MREILFRGKREYDGIDNDIDDCAECKCHDVFWEGAGCLLINNMEKCKFTPKEQSETDHPTEKGGVEE